jgi:hypothetical protein
VQGAARLAELSVPGTEQNALKVWTKWAEIIQFIEKESVSTDTFKSLLKEWGLLLLNTFEWKICTAYTHIIVAHSVENLARWGNISDLSQQGLEAANRVHKQVAHGASNHSKKNSVHQIFFHIYRLML